MYTYLALSENGFLFDTRSGCTYSLNAPGAFVLQKMMRGAAPSSIAETMTETFSVAVGPAFRDIAQFVLRLKELGLISEDEETVE
jgi:hypothetical protein